MSISEQVKELRNYANLAAISKNEENMILRAAGTIESLSAKLQAANMDRSEEDCGGWIACKDRLPTMKECQKNDCRFILDDGNRRYQGIFDYIDKKFIYFNREGTQTDKCVIRWHEFPAPYHEP